MFYSQEEYDAYHDEMAAGYAADCREYARNVGGDVSEREWLLTDYDTWERNPHYTGPKGHHPEDDQDEYDQELAGPFEPFVIRQSDDDDIPF